MNDLSRQKNALTKYEVAAVSETPEWLELGKWITNVTDDTEDTTEDFSDYAGDGTVSVDVTGVAESYGFEGTYDKENAAMKYIADMRHELGEGRKTLFRVTDPDGETFTGQATVSDIVYRGGEASGYPEFGCSIRFDTKPQKADSNGA